MKILFFIILFFHGIIHFIGFAKAFNLKEIKELTLPISPSYGILWLTTGILILLSAFLFTFENIYWWLPAFIGIIISQILIITFWKDTKFGTIPNLIILIAAIAGYASFNFQNKVASEVDGMIHNLKVNKLEILDSTKILKLPIAVQNWLKFSGTVGKPIVKSVSLKQKAQMKMKSDQTDWYKAEANQYFDVNTSSFIWTVKMEMMSFINILGRDKLINGKGEMLIKMFGLLPLVDTKDNSKLNMGSAQRYLAEIVWFPSAALSKNITWQSIDDSSATATITVNETIADGKFYFKKDGSLKKFSTLRYFGGEENSELKEWIITPNEIKEMNGIKIPIKSTATWKLENGDWDWLKVEITEINYN